MNINKLVGYLSIRHKLIIAFLAVSCIPLISFVVYDAYIFHRVASSATYNNLDGSAFISIGAIGVFLIGVLIAGFFASKHFTKPIEELRRGTRSIAQGNLNYRIGIQTNDEIELLADDFNSMAKSISDLQTRLNEHASDLEEKVKARTREIEREKQKLDNIVKGIGTGLALVNREYRLFWYNDIFREWFGEIDVSQGTKCYELAGIKPDECPAVGTFSDGLIRQIEHAMITRAGDERVFQFTAGPIWEGGDIASVLVMMQDITERKQLEAQLIHQEKMAALGLLAAGVAHEIGNPLSSLSSLVQYSQRKSDDESVKETFPLMRSHIDRISNIVREMVDFSRPPKYEWCPTDVNDVIKSAMGIASYDPRSSNLAMKASLDPEISVTDLAPDQLLQVCLNIILNSFDAINSGGELTIASKQIGKDIEITFKDNGSGIDKEVIDHIFEPFFTTKEVGKGVGLGLSVSYGIIKNFGGRILVESEVGSGTTFTIVLPLKKESHERVHTHS